MSAAWASQKIMEQSKRWQQDIKPTHPVQISPELKVLLVPLNNSQYHTCPGMHHSMALK